MVADSGSNCQRTVKECGSPFEGPGDGGGAVAEGPGREDARRGATYIPNIECVAYKMSLYFVFGV